MAATNADQGREALPVWFSAVLRRLGEIRWPLIAAVAISLALWLAAGVSPLVALVVLFLFTAAVLAVPRPADSALLVAAIATPASPSAPEAGIGHLAEALPHPCFILDRRGVVRYANRQAARAYPIRTGEPVTSRLRVPDVVAAFDRVARGGPAERVEFAERVPTERWFVAWFSRLDETGSAGDSIALIIEDLTERRRSEKIRVDFVANASHELRTPLASLAGFIETLQGPARDDPVARGRFLKVMHEQATRMSRLVNDLLSLSRIEMKQHLRPSGETNLGGLVAHVVDALEPLARELGVEFELHLPDAPVQVTGDRDELIQVFENLIENACKYGQPGKRVVVSVATPVGGTGPAVSVRDFGPGIAAEHLPRLTEQFYRADVEASRQHRGTGLGLAIVKHILARHQARLAVESRLGEGALFTVVFPQAAVADLANSRDNTYTDQTLTLS